MFKLIFMGIQIRSFVYLIIFIKWKCLNFYLVPSFEVNHSGWLSGYFDRKYLIFLQISSYFLSIH